jgi:hypothetical protein
LNRDLPQSAGPHYVGCFNDAVDRRLSQNLGNMYLNDCYNKAKDLDKSKFGMQYANGVGGNKAQCWVGDDTNYGTLGTSTNCSLYDDNLLGNSWANAVYSI